MNNEKMRDELLTEMFKMVDLTYNAKENRNRNENWFAEHSWTEAQQKLFTDFGVALLRKKKRLTKRAAEKGMSWFILGYGWKVEYKEQECIK